MMKRTNKFLLLSFFLSFIGVKNMAQTEGGDPATFTLVEWWG